MSPAPPPFPRLTIFGCGYVGSAVAAAALAHGWQVTAMTRNADTATRLRARGIAVVVGDLSRRDWHDAIDPEQDFVLNSVSSAGGGLPGYWQSYVEGTKSILNWTKSAPGVTYVYTSSTSVYPQHEGEIVDEESSVGGGSSASEPLLEAERLVTTSACFARWFILRLSGIYGPGRHYLLDQLRAGANEFPGTGIHRLNLAHRDDVASAITACFSAPGNIRDQIFNISGDVAVSKAEVTTWLANQINVPVPRFVGDPDGPPVDVTVRTRGRSGPVPDRVFNNQRIKSELGWRPQYPDFRDGYQAILDEEKTKK